MRNCDMCYNAAVMRPENPFRSARVGRDQLVWAVIGIVLLAYVLLQANRAVGIVATVVALLLAITAHESAHAWAADRLGDPTARLAGRISLNPVVHLDPLGSIMMVLSSLTGMGIGWGKPVPVAPHRLRYGPRLGNGIVALAGPAANLLLATVVGLVFRIAWQLISGWMPLIVFELLDAVILVNILIAFFNLLPIPPLDGSSVLVGLLSLSRDRWAWRASEFVLGLQQQGPLILLGVILVSQFMGLNLIGRIIGPPSRLLYRLILGL